MDPCRQLTHLPLAPSSIPPHRTPRAALSGLVRQPSALAPGSRVPDVAQRGLAVRPVLRLRLDQDVLIPRRIAGGQVANLSLVAPFPRGRRVKDYQPDPLGWPRPRARGRRRRGRWITAGNEVKEDSRRRDGANATARDVPLGSAGRSDSAECKVQSLTLSTALTGRLLAGFDAPITKITSESRFMNRAFARRTRAPLIHV